MKNPIKTTTKERNKMKYVCECCGTRHDPMKTDCPEEPNEPSGEVDFVELAESAGARPINH